MLVFHILCILIRNELALSASESEANNPVFNLDHTALEKNIAAIFNKVAHSSATTKRSVPAYEAQVSQSTTHSTSPSPVITTLTTSSMLYPMIAPKVTHPPLLRELPSYAPPSRALFTPPLPPEYANPFADKPTLRGTNIELHSSARRPIPPPSLTPAHERIPIKPPDLIEDTIKYPDTQILFKDRIVDSVIKDSFEMSDREKELNDTVEFVPSLHFTSISRILSGSNGRKQDIPEILLKPIPTKLPLNFLTTKLVNESSPTILITKSTYSVSQTVTIPSIIPLLNRKSEDKNIVAKNFYGSPKKSNEPYSVHNGDIIHSERFPYPQTRPPTNPSEKPDKNNNNQNIIPHLNKHPLETTWKIVWSLHVYLAASMFTIVALYSVYKIVRYNEATNLLTQSYFLTIHLLLTVVCTLRCFHLFYDAYNLGNSFPEILSNVLMFLPSSLLAAAFATLILYMSRCSSAPSLYRSKFSSPIILIFAFIIHITLCISLHVSGSMLGYIDDSKILPLICQCIYIIICVTLGLSYMYVYRVIRTQLHITSTKSVNNHITTDCTTTLNTAITTTVATALLFILMGFVQLYGIFGIKRHLQPYPWLWWGWEFSVRLLELSMCGLLAWVASLSNYQLQEKQIQQHIVHSGFALFPCGNSTSTENMDDALYPAICSTNQAIQNYAIRTGKQVYDDSFPLNTLPESINVSSTFERHSTKRSVSSSGHFPQEMRSSFGQCRNDTLSLCNSENRSKTHTLPLNVHEHPSSSGSTMLVAEDGFVRFRNLGPDEEESSDPPSLIGSSDERRSSITCSDKFKMKQSTTSMQMTQNLPENSLPHLHLSIHRNQHQIYNNT